MFITHVFILSCFVWLLFVEYVNIRRTYLLPLEEEAEGGGGYRLIGRVISRTLNTLELDHNVVKRAEYFVSLQTSVLTEQCNVMVNSEELIGTTEYLTLWTRYGKCCCPYNLVRLYFSVRIVVIDLLKGKRHLTRILVTGTCLPRTHVRSVL
jgi:hypothetical protein